MHQFFIRIFIVLVSGLLLMVSSCSTPEQIVSERQIPEVDNKYDSEFPIASVSKELDYLSTTVKKLDCLAFYKSYAFPPDNQIDPAHITEAIIKDQSISSTVINESVSGTAIVVYYDGGRVGLLTCAHVVDFPDTIVIRYLNGEGPLEVLSVKIKQQNFVKDLPVGEDVEVIAIHKKNDIALLGKKLDEYIGSISVLNYPVGNTKDLDWGSLVYIMGYPAGQLMVTRAIVSNPDKERKGRFLTDALYNRGISGGPIIAIRDGMPNFELVGMASSASARHVYYLKPGKTTPEYINTEEPFSGELFVDQYKDIKYGVTFNVSIEAITDFLNKNKTLLTNKGFDSQQFFR